MKNLLKKLKNRLKFWSYKDSIIPGSELIDESEVVDLGEAEQALDTFANAVRNVVKPISKKPKENCRVVLWDMNKKEIDVGEFNVKEGVFSGTINRTPTHYIKLTDIIPVFYEEA